MRVRITLSGDLVSVSDNTWPGAERLAVIMSKEVEFLYDCIKAGKISKEQAKELLSSSTKSGQSSQCASSSGNPKAATVCSGFSPWHSGLGAGRNSNTSASEKAELFAKYKAAQMMSREKSLKCKGPGKMKASTRASRTAVLTKISMGGMKFDDIKQCGKRCKELGPMTGVSLPPAATYEEVIGKAKEEFFSMVVGEEGKYEYFLADPQGSRLSKTINGNQWNLAEYIHLHGYYPSKTKIYCVQCDKERSETEKKLIEENEEKEPIQISDDQSHSASHVPRQPTIPQPHVTIQPGRNKCDKEGDKDEPDGYLIPASSLVLGTRLGEGGFGTVYLSDLNGTLVAVKQLKLDKSADVDHMNEVKALSTLRHPNIVLFMGYSHQDNCIQIVTNYVEGNDLYHLLFKEKKHILICDKTSIGEQTAQALAYMHSLKPPMIHRDVKPSNILVERGTLHVYITDMGLARIKMGCTTMTQVGVIGTPYYAAPETFKGEAGTPSDVWALGMVLLELYGEQHAWGTVKSQQHLVGKIMTKQLPSIAHLDKTKQDVCRACLNYEPKARKSVQEVLQLLRTMIE